MIDLDSSDFHMFEAWATDYYKHAINVCIEAAGGDSPDIFSRLLEKSLPSLVELYAEWKAGKTPTPLAAKG